MSDENLFYRVGAGIVSGIWLYRASLLEPAKHLEVNPEQIRNVFFDFTPTEPGQVTFGMYVDGVQIGEIQGTTFGQKDIGRQLPFAFWYPAQARTKGMHTITIKTGKQVLEKWFIFKRQRTRWIDSYDFTVDILRDEER